MNLSQPYDEVADRLPAMITAARPLVAGFTATVDAVHHLDAEGLGRVITAVPDDHPPAFAAGLRELQRRLRLGLDGELFIDDPEAEPQLIELVGRPARLQPGGTSLQAAWSWATLGLDPLLSLADRSPRQLEVVDPRIRLATDRGPERAAQVPATRPAEAPRPANHPLEFTAGTEAAGVRITRSSRITVVLRRKTLQHDDHFDLISPVLSAGAGLVSGLNGLGSGRAVALERVASLLRAWRAGGVSMVHLELAEYGSVTELAEVLAAVGPHLHSVGMSESEFRSLVDSGQDLVGAAAEFGARHRLTRVVVHADRWAMAVHRDDDDRQRLALAAGCLAASCRAELGRPSASLRLPERADFSADVPAETSRDGWTATVVSSPYLSRPHSTIGLGDTFVSGDLLVHSATT